MASPPAKPAQHAAARPFTLRSISDIVRVRHRERRALRAIGRAVSSGKAADIPHLMGSEGGYLSLAATAVEAVLLLRSNEVRRSQKLLNAVYRLARDGETPQLRLIRLYCLYHLAAIRGAHADCFAHATKAASLGNVGALRKAMSMPKPVERNVIGTFVTSTA